MIIIIMKWSYLSIVISEELLLLDRNVNNDKIKSGLDAVSSFFYTQQQAIVSKMCSNENG
jgi:hypothetical protein